MPFNQDDARERAMVARLNLQQDLDRARHDADGHLDVDLEGAPHRLFFECKSAPENGDFGTGRDTGPRQLRRWATMHFAFGWFAPRDNTPSRLWYASPRMMRSWNAAEQEYLGPDLALLEVVPDAVDDSVVDRVLGLKDEYTYADLRALLKAQWNANEAEGQPNLYRERADVHRGRSAQEHRYSPAVAREAVEARVRYLLARGGTVNNRKISASYVQANCRELRFPGVAVDLQQAVLDALAQEPPTPTAA